MALGAYGAETARGNVLNAIAHPNVVDPVAGMSAAVTAARGIQDLRTQQFNLQQAQLQPGYQAMRMLAATNPNPTNDDINAALGGAARLGGNVDGVVQNLSDWTARGGKPADFVRAYALGGMSPENQAQMGLGVPENVNTGSSLVSGVRGGVLSSAPGQFTPSSSIALGLTPGEATTMVQVPDLDANGRPTGTFTSKPAGTVYGTGVPGGGSAGGSAGGAGGGSGVVPAGPPPGSSVQPGQPLSQKDAALAQYAQRESGNQNIFSNVQVPGYTQQQLGSGYYQIIPSTWAEGQQLAGIPPNQRTQLAIQAPPQQQYQVASALYDRYGGQPWARSAPGGAGGGGGGGGPPATGPFIGATSAQPVTGGVPAQPGGGSPVQPVGGGGMPSYDQTGRPIVQGGGGGGGGGGGRPSTGGSGVSVGPDGVPRDASGAPSFPQPSPYMAAKWDASARMYTAAAVDASNYQARTQPLVSARAILENNPDLTTGAGADAVNRIKSGLMTMGTIFSPSDMQSIGQAKFDELGKYLQQAVNASPFAASSDAKLASTISGSPGTHLSTLANKEVLIGMIGLERMKQMAFTEFQQSGQSPAQWSDFKTSWETSHDPRAFVVDMLDAAHRDKLSAALKTPAERSVFQNSLNLIKANPNLMIQAPMTQ